MADGASAERLMQELGPVLNPEAILKIGEAGYCWSVVVRDDVRIDVSFEEINETFVFLAMLGAVPEDAAKDVYELLLRFSFLVRENGGLHAALDAEGEAVLAYRCPAGDLDVSRLAALLGNLATYVEAWSKTIDGTSPGDASHRLMAMDPAAGIRV